MKRIMGSRDEVSELSDRAERRLSSRRGAEQALSPDDVSRLFHELQVHQIELEMQNDELRRAQEELEASRKRYADLFDLSPVCYIILTEQGLIQSANLNAVRLLGIGRRRLLKKPFHLAIAEEDRDNLYLHLRKAMKDEVCCDCVLKLVSANGSVRYVELCSRVVPSPTEAMILTALVDVSGRRIREAQIAFQASLLDQVRNAVIATDLEGHIIYWNSFAESLHQWQAHEVLGKYIVDLLVPEENREAGEELFKQIKSRGHYQGEFSLQRKDGRVFPAFFCISPMSDAHTGTTGLVGISIDISARKRAEEQLASKTMHLEEVNAAMKVLLKHRDEQKMELQEDILSNVRNLVLPYLDRLKQSRLDSEQLTHVGILENHLQEIISPFSKRLSHQACTLSPMEVQVADLVRAGKSNKEIADLLHLSKNTILTHRYRLRNKLGLRNSKTALRSHLESMT
jgi:PAS domain S-box-containing protein